MLVGSVYRLSDGQKMQLLLLSKSGEHRSWSM